MTLQEARNKWDEMEKTKFSIIEIKQTIDNAFEYSHDPHWATANAQTAQSMIAYNDMIDRKIKQAKKSWGVK